MPKRQNRVRVTSEIVQGSDSYVIITPPKVSEARETRKELAAIADEIEEAAAAGNDELVAKLEERQESLSWSQMSRYVVGWNWVDDDGNPLPQPHGNPEVFSQLTTSEVSWLGDQFGKLSQVSDAKKKS